MSKNFEPSQNEKLGSIPLDTQQGITAAWDSLWSLEEFNKNVGAWSDGPKHEPLEAHPNAHKVDQGAGYVAVQGYSRSSQQFL